MAAQAKNLVLTYWGKLPCILYVRVRWLDNVISCRVPFPTLLMLVWFQPDSHACLLPKYLLINHSHELLYFHVFLLSLSRGKKCVCMCVLICQWRGRTQWNNKSYRPSGKNEKVPSQELCKTTEISFRCSIPSSYYRHLPVSQESTHTCPSTTIKDIL